MDNLGEMRAAVQSDLTVSSDSSLFDPSTINLAINRSYRKAGGLFNWPETEDSKKTSTIANQDYYDFPQNWRPYSIFRLEIDNVQYGEEPDGSPLNYNDFLIWKRSKPNATDKKWAMQWRRYFISPTPTSNGSFNMVIWGQKVVDLLEQDDDTTIFSYAMPECNEAIVLEAVAILRGKGQDEKAEEFKSLEARGILARAYDHISREKAKIERNQPMFYVPDFMSTRSKLRSDIIGDF